MYKIDRKTLEEVVRILDEATGKRPLVGSTLNFINRATKLSKTIKDNFIEIKP
jgi:hypothetical protein